MPGEERASRTFFLLALLSVLLYHLSFLGLFFLLPLQILCSRQGVSALYRGSALALAGICAVKVLWKVFDHTDWTILDSAELAAPCLLILGLAAMAFLERLSWRFLYRLLAVTVAVGLVSFPVLSWLLKQDSVLQVVQNEFNKLWATVFQSPGLNVPGLMEQINKEEFFNLLKESFLGGFLLMFFLMWAITWKLDNVLVSRRTGKRQTLRDFFLPPEGVWVFLGVWGLMLGKGLLTRFNVDWDWGFYQYPLTNVALIVLILYCLAGWGVLQTLLDRWKWPALAQTAFKSFLVLSLAIQEPFLQGVVLIGLPTLAVLELWVNLRKREQRG